MAKQERNGKIIKISGMSVAGGNLTGLAQGQKYFVNLELDYSDCTLEEVIDLASGGSSVRVQAQAKLRADESTLKAKGVKGFALGDVEEGLKSQEYISFNVSTDFESETGKPRDPQKTAASAYGKMDREQKIQFVMGALGLTREQAEEQVK